MVMSLVVMSSMAMSIMDMSSMDKHGTARSSSTKKNGVSMWRGDRRGNMYIFE